jgi:TPR repeat protein
VVKGTAISLVMTWVFAWGDASASGELIPTRKYDHPRQMLPREGETSRIFPRSKTSDAQLGGIARHADAGDRTAQYLLGYAYWSGEFVERDLDRAIYWLREAVKDPTGLKSDVWYTLGCALIQRGKPEDIDAGVTAFLQQDPPDYFTLIALSKIHRFGVGVAADSDAADAWVQQLADRLVELESIILPGGKPKPRTESIRLLEVLLRSDRCLDADHETAHRADEFFPPN